MWKYLEKELDNCLALKNIFESAISVWTKDNYLWYERINKISITIAKNNKGKDKFGAIGCIRFFFSSALCMIKVSTPSASLSLELCAKWTKYDLKTIF